MTKITKKLSILLTTNDQNLQFSINPTGIISAIDTNKFLYEKEIVVDEKTVIQIYFGKKMLENSYLKIESIKFNNITLNYIDSFSFFSVTGKTKKTYGWMDEEGCYTIKLHCNPITQNLISYLLSTKN
jgi:hypothetical protein